MSSIPTDGSSSGEGYRIVLPGAGGVWIPVRGGQDCAIVIGTVEERDSAGRPIAGDPGDAHIILASNRNRKLIGGVGHQGAHVLIDATGEIIRAGVSGVELGSVWNDRGVEVPGTARDSTPNIIKRRPHQGVGRVIINAQSSKLKAEVVDASRSGKRSRRGGGFTKHADGGIT